LPGPGGQGLIPCENVLPKAAQKGFTSGGLNLDADLQAKAARTVNPDQTTGILGAEIVVLSEPC
jgi:hypothetical protein